MFKVKKWHLGLAIILIVLSLASVIFSILDKTYGNFLIELFLFILAIKMWVFLAKRYREQNQNRDL